MTPPTRYRIKLAGAFPQVVPKHIDKAFDTPRQAVVYAMTQIVRSGADRTKLVGFTRFTICEITASGADGAQMMSWAAGE